MLGIMKIATGIAGYFVASMGLTFFQKSVIIHLPYPITIVVFHLFLKFILSGVTKQLMAWFLKKPMVVIRWNEYLGKVAIVAVLSALDIGLSQWSFKFITVSLYTMTKTTSIVFIMLFAMFFKLEKKGIGPFLIIVMISGGLFLFVFKSTSFHFIGFLLVLTASFLSGARWTTSQIVMQKGNLAVNSPNDLIYCVQPIMILTLLPFSLIFEGYNMALTKSYFGYETGQLLMSSLGATVFGGVLAFLMELFEFLIVSEASSVTLSIVGVLKEVTTIGIDIAWNGNSVSNINLLGIVICLSGISWHVVRKIKANQPAVQDRHQR